MDYENYEEFETLEDEKRNELESELRNLQEEYEDVLDNIKYTENQKEIAFDDDIADLELELDALWERKEELEYLIEEKKEDIKQLDVLQEGE